MNLNETPLNCFFDFYIDGFSRQYPSFHQLFEKCRLKATTLCDFQRNGDCAFRDHSLYFPRQWLNGISQCEKRYHSNCWGNYPVSYLLKNDLSPYTRSQRYSASRCRTIYRTPCNSPHRRTFCIGRSDDLYKARKPLGHGRCNFTRMDGVSSHPTALFISQKNSRLARNCSHREVNGVDFNSNCRTNVFKRAGSIHPRKSIKLTVAYLGTQYFGWQKTRSGPSIQEELEIACSQICQEKIICEAASRTDRGVHAKGQIVQFYTSKELSPEQIQKVLNALLPVDIRVIQAEYQNFHPTLDATAKTYYYDLCTHAIQDPFQRHVSWHYPFQINFAKMSEATFELIGSRDFSAFTTNQSKNPICNLFKIELFMLDRERIRIAMTADRFLYKMARTIAGTLANIGSGKLVLKTHKTCRSETGVTAPAHGLTLAMVYYQTE